MVDILPKISGVEFESAWQRRVNVQVDDALAVPFISRDDLLAAKISAGRAQDLADVAALRESREQSEINQLGMPASGSRARGRENWLELRRQQAEKAQTPAPEHSQDEKQNDSTKDCGKSIDDDMSL
jgi:hypothetical protein